MWIKRVYRFFVSLLLGLFLLVLVAFTFVHLYQDEIVALFIRQANNYINTPVQTEQVSVSLFTNFPDVAIAFDNVWMQEGFAGSQKPLAVARRVYCTFSILDLIRKDYKIREIHLEDAEIFLRVKPSGAVNYQVIDRKGEEVIEGKQAMAFDLEKIRLDNVAVNYEDQRHDQLHRILAKNVQARLKINEPVYDIQLAGQLDTREIRVGEQQYFKEQEVELDTRFSYHLENEQLQFDLSQLMVESSTFLVKGDIGTSGDILLDLSIETPQTDFQTLVAVLPPEYSAQIRTYESRGELKFSGKVKGNAGGGHMPLVEVDFSAHKASFFHPDYGQSIDEVSLRGRYTNGAERANRTSVLQIHDLQASLNKKPISGSLLLRNFDDYFLSFQTKSELNAKSFLKFYPLKNISQADGLLNINLDFAGRLKDLKSGKSIRKVKAGGEVMVQNLSFKPVNTSYPIRELNGSLIFNNNDLALSNLSGHAGNSSFVLNGLFKNIFSYLLLDNQPITIEADLQSGNLDLDELLSDAHATDAPASGEDDRFYSFDIRPDMNLYFNCQADKLKFDRFRAENISGELSVANGVAQVKNVRLRAAGGNMTIKGSVDARQADLVDVKVQARFENIYVDSAFWIFNNFNQDFLTDQNIKGRITADVMSGMQFDKKLRFHYPKLIVNADAAIVDGQLKDFEPMQNLSTFINEERLANIRFSEITSNIQVRNQTIYLPETIIRSDISAVTVKGTHTFNQHINYHVRVPVQTLLTGKRKEVPPAAAQADGVNGMHLLLLISGTTDDYKITYDAEAVKEKIVEDIRKEGKELKEAIKNKTARTRKDVELDEEEYFDW